MWAAINTIVTDLATVGTFIVAVLVYGEAKRIRRAEGIFRQNQAWNEFGNSVIEFHGETRIEALLMGREAGRPTAVTCASRDEVTLVEAFLLMSLFNVVSSEYYALCAKVIDEKYVMHSFALTYGVLRRNEGWIFGFLDECGYEASFVRCLRVVERKGPNVEAITRGIRAELCSAPGK